MKMVYQYDSIGEEGKQSIWIGIFVAMLEPAACKIWTWEFETWLVIQCIMSESKITANNKSEHRFFSMFFSWNRWENAMRARIDSNGSMIMAHKFGEWNTIIGERIIHDWTWLRSLLIILYRTDVQICEQIFFWILQFVSCFFPFICADLFCLIFPFKCNVCDWSVLLVFIAAIKMGNCKICIFLMPMNSQIVRYICCYVFF